MHNNLVWCRCKYFCFYQCSTECDSGEQVREVVCITILRGSLRVVLDMNCPANKPETRRSCSGALCGSSWFISDWTEVISIMYNKEKKKEIPC